MTSWLPRIIRGRRAAFQRARAAGRPRILGKLGAVIPEQVSGDIGTGLVLLGRADGAVDALKASLAPGGSGRWSVIKLVDLAAARVLQGEPEQACDDLLRALKLATSTTSYAWPPTTGPSTSSQASPPAYEQLLDIRDRMTGRRYPHAMRLGKRDRE
ncbi:MAG: hypothetical protein ACRDTT_04745 [Pseudonocardiaceae bacterium]